jgi:PAS domain S-box-containing protein
MGLPFESAPSPGEERSPAPGGKAGTRQMRALPRLQGTGGGRAGSGAGRRRLLLLIGLALLHLSHRQVWGLPEPGLWSAPLAIGIALVAWLGPVAGLLVAADGILAGLQGWAAGVPSPLTGSWLRVAGILGEAWLTGLEAWFAWALYSRAVRGYGYLGDPRTAAAFLVVVTGFIVGVATLLRLGLLVGLASWQGGRDAVAAPDLWHPGALNCVGRGLGVLTLTPFLLTVVTPWLVRRRLLSQELRRLNPVSARREPLHWGDWVELAGLALGTGLLGVVLALGSGTAELTAWQIWGLPLLFVVWASLRWGLPGGTAVAAAAGVFCLLAGPPVAAGGVALSPLQGNLLAQSITALLVGASITWIRANERRYRQVVGHIPVVLYSARLATLAGKGEPRRVEITFVSAASRTLLGLEPTELEGDYERWLRQVHPEDRELITAALTQLRRGHGPVACEYRLHFPTAHGRPPVAQANAQAPQSNPPPAERWLRDTLVPHVNPQGQVEGWEGVVEDITGQRALASDLRRTSNMLHALVAHLPAGVFFVQGPTGQPLLVNARARQLLGQREDSTAGLAHLAQVYRLFRPDGTPYPTDQLPVSKALCRGLTNMRDDIVVHRPDGRRIPLVSWAAPVVLTGQGKPDAAVWVLEDLTALRRAEEAREGSEEKYRGLVESLPLMLLQADREARISYANPATAEIIGYTPDELCGPEAWHAIIHPEDLSRVRQLHQLCAAGQGGRAEVRFRAKDGAEKVCYAIFQPRRQDGAPAGFTVLAVDMTVQRGLEQELERSHRLELVGRLAGGIAHDFNNLLTVVLTLAYLARDQLPTDHPVRDDLRRIGDAGEQAARLAGHLLTFTKHRGLAVTVVDLGRAAARTLELLTGSLPPSVRVRRMLATEPLRVKADETQLQQVLMNLCLNARDAMPRGGELTVATFAAGKEPERTGEPPDDSPPPSEPPGPGANWVCLSVRDTGSGMGEDVRGRMFEPFFSTKERGTGLGLAVVRQIVDGFGGQIKVWSRPGRGTRFDVWLPRSG